MVLAHNINIGQRTRDVQINQDVTFDSMLLSEFTVQGLKKSGFYKPSPVQLLGIPLGKCGFDLLLEAKSGTGKTAVFSVIALEKIDLNIGLQAIIMAPTREIAFQICDVLKIIGSKYSGLIVEVVMGGLPVEEDIEKFQKNVHIVVGSPGRLRHLIQSKHINMSSVRLIVLDEADKLIGKSFIRDINYIFSVLPSQRQVILSSATYSEDTRKLINKYVVNAQHVCPDSTCILRGVEQKIAVVKFNTNIVRQTQYRFDELHKILSQKPFKQCVIFCNYQARVVELYKLLKRAKWPVEILYGQQEQSDRLDALKTLQQYNCRILICTDLAARGIDASNVDLVVNFEVPVDWQTYLHRIGRAGRYGSYGMAVTILSKGKEEEKFKNVLGALNLNITPLWDNCETNINPDAQILTTNNSTDKTPETQIEENCNDLWNILTCGNVETQKDIECFETLCASFHQTGNTPIVPFVDVVNSHRNQTENLEEGEYRHIEMKSTSVDQVLKQIKELKVTGNGNIFNEDNNNIEDVAIKSHYNDKFQMSKKIEFQCQSDNHNDIESNNLKLKKGYPLQNTQLAPLRNSVLDSDLPLSFNSRKHKKYNGIIENSDYKYNVIKPKPMKISTEIQIKKESKTENLLPQGDIYKMKYLLKNSNQKQHHYRKICTVGHHSSENINNKDMSDSKQHCLNEDYRTWYNNLKFKVKQIEYALYIDEITRI